MSELAQVCYPRIVFVKDEQLRAEGRWHHGVKRRLVGEDYLQRRWQQFLFDSPSPFALIASSAPPPSPPSSCIAWFFMSVRNLHVWMQERGRGIMEQLADDVEFKGGHGDMCISNRAHVVFSERRAELLRVRMCGVASCCKHCHGK